MKILKSISMVLAVSTAVLLMASSCDGNKDDGPKRIIIDEDEVTFEADWNDEYVIPVKISDGTKAWRSNISAAASKWVDLDSSTASSLVIKVEGNALEVSREATITLSAYNTKDVTITITQKAGDGYLPIPCKNANYVGDADRWLEGDAGMFEVYAQSVARKHMTIIAFSGKEKDDPKTFKPELGNYTAVDIKEYDYLPVPRMTFGAGYTNTDGRLFFSYYGQASDPSKPQILDIAYLFTGGTFNISEETNGYLLKTNLTGLNYSAGKDGAPIEDLKYKTLLPLQFENLVVEYYSTLKTDINPVFTLAKLGKFSSEEINPATNVWQMILYTDNIIVGGDGNLGGTGEILMLTFVTEATLEDQKIPAGTYTAQLGPKNPADYEPGILFDGYMSGSTYAQSWYLKLAAGRVQEAAPIMSGDFIVNENGSVSADLGDDAPTTNKITTAYTPPAGVIGTIPVGKVQFSNAAARAPHFVK